MFNSYLSKNMFCYYIILYYQGNALTTVQRMILHIYVSFSFYSTVSLLEIKYVQLNTWKNAKRKIEISHHVETWLTVSQVRHCRITSS